MRHDHGDRRATGFVRRGKDIKADGSFVLPDGSVHQSPSLAAMRSADLPSYDGWHAWQVPRLDGTKLNDLRIRYVAESETGSSAENVM